MFAHIRNHARSKNPDVADDRRHEIERYQFEKGIPHVDARRGRIPDFCWFSAANSQTLGQLPADELVAARNDVNGNSLMSRGGGKHPRARLIEKPRWGDCVGAYEDDVGTAERLRDGGIGTVERVRESGVTEVRDRNARQRRVPLPTGDLLTLDGSRCRRRELRVSLELP
jgi:hypothetical protein